MLLTFLPRDFHVFGCSDACACGYLEARGGMTKESKLLGKYCGSTAPSPVYSWGRHMWLGFAVDSHLSRKGFRATYSVVPSLEGIGDEVTVVNVLVNTLSYVGC